MTDMVNVENPRSVSNKLFGKDRPAYKVDETNWGYIVRGTQATAFGVEAAQFLSCIAGAVCLSAAAGIKLMPSAFVPDEASIMRSGAAFIFAALGILTLWYSSRGSQVELQVDTSRGELREVVRNKTGQSTLLERYSFNAIGGVFLDRSAADGSATLLVRYRNSAQTMFVASGNDDGLYRLCSRMGRDLSAQ